MSGTQALSQLIYPGAAILLFAGVLKLSGLLRESHSTSSSEGTGLVRIFTNNYFVFFLSIIEIVIGAFVFAGIFVKFFAFAQMYLYLAFTLWLFYGLKKNLASCKCFGVAKPQKPSTFGIKRNLVMALLTLLGIFGGAESITFVGFILSLAAIILIYRVELK